LVGPFGTGHLIAGGETSVASRNEEVMVATNRPVGGAADGAAHRAYQILLSVQR